MKIDLRDAGASVYSVFVIRDIVSLYYLYGDISWRPRKIMMYSDQGLI